MEPDTPESLDPVVATARCPECTREVPFADLMRHLMKCLGIELGSRLLVGPLIVNIGTADSTRGGVIWLAEGLEYDRDGFRLKVGDAVLELTKKDALLLDYFVSNPRIVLSRARIIEAVWDVGAEVKEREVDTYVSRLRRMLGQHPEGDSVITTVHGAGYRFDFPER